MHTSLKELQVAAVQRMDTNCQRCSGTEEEPMAGTSKFAFFSCPEEGYVKTYHTFYILKPYLDLEKLG